VVESRLLLTWRVLLLVLHLIDLLRLLIRLALTFSPRRLLVLLGEIARLAAASTKAVFASVALQMVLGTDIAARDHGKNEGEA
jgi:hypothetical protein